MRIRILLLGVMTTTILVAGGFAQQQTRCESNDMGRHYCDVGPNGGVTLSRQISDAKCIQGQTFGVEGNRMWVDRGCRGEFNVLPGRYRPQDRGYGHNGVAQQQVRCESDDMRRHYCDIGPNGGVRLSRQISDAGCVQGQTFGVEGPRMWVDRGCRGEFEVLSGRGGRDRDERWRGDRGGWNNQHTQVVNVRCDSNNERRKSCSLDGEILRARLLRQISGAECRQGKSWGYEGSRLWVDRGCRAEFEVTLRQR